MNEYIRIGNTTIHIIQSDKQEYKYMAMVYDMKQYMWRNADIYADSMEDVAKIANIVFGEDTTDLDKDITITVDYNEPEI